MLVHISSLGRCFLLAGAGSFHVLRMQEGRIHMWYALAEGEPVGPAQGPVGAESHVQRRLWSLCLCMCVCVCGREGGMERESVCVCEGEGKRESVCSLHCVSVCVCV